MSSWNRKGGGGLLWDKASAKLFAVPGKCTADTGIDTGGGGGGGGGGGKAP